MTLIAMSPQSLGRLSTAVFLATLVAVSDAVPSEALMVTEYEVLVSWSKAALVVICPELLTENEEASVPVRL